MNDNFEPQLRQIAEDEAWLARHETPRPSARALADVRKAIRTELKRAQAAPRRPMLQAWQGAIAAAAVLGLSVTVAWQSVATYQRPVGLNGRELVAAIDPGPVWPQATEKQTQALSDIESGLSGLESWSQTVTVTDATSGSLYNALEDAMLAPVDEGTKPTGTSSIAPAHRMNNAEDVT